MQVRKGEHAQRVVLTTLKIGVGRCPHFVIEETSEHTGDLKSDFL